MNIEPASPVSPHTPKLFAATGDSGALQRIAQIASDFGFELIATDAPLIASRPPAEMAVVLLDSLLLGDGRSLDDLLGHELSPGSDDRSVILGYRDHVDSIPDAADDVADLNDLHDLRRALSRAQRLVRERRARRMSNRAGHAVLAALDLVPAYLTLLDGRGRRVWSSDAVGRDFNVDLPSIIGTDYLTAHGRRRSDATSKAVERLFRESLSKPGAPLETFTEGLRPDGTSHRYLMRMTNLLERPEIGAVVVMTTEIPNATVETPALPSGNPLISFQSIIEQGPLVTFINSIQPAEHIVFVSPQVEALLHLPVSMLTDPDFDWIERIHPVDRERITRESALADAGMNEIATEYRYLTGLGDYRWIRSISRLAQNERGEAIWIGNILDIEGDRRLRETAERHDVELHALRQMRRLIAQEADLGVIFDQAVALLVDTFAYPMVRIYTREDDLPVLKSSGGIADPDLHPDHLGTINRVARSGEMVVAGPVTDDGDSLVASGGRIEAITAEIAGPLVDRDRVPGVIVVGGTRELPLLPADVLLIETVAEYLSMAATRARLQSEAREQGLTYQAVVERVREVIFHLSASLEIRYVNPAWSATLGYAPDQQLGMSLLDVIHPDDRARIDDLFEALDRDEMTEIVTETQVLTRDSQIRWMELRARVDSRVEERSEYSGMLVDITDRRRSDEALRESNERFRKLAFQDPLTGLPNRLVFHDRLQHALAVASRRDTGVAVLFVDLDGFKPVNDLYGHSAGDRVLSIVGERLAERMRHGDTIARFGGDEFAIILEDLVDASQAMTIASELIEMMQRPVEVFDDFIVVGMSVGVTYLGGRVVSTEDAVAEADAALYDAKKRGRGRYEIFEHANASVEDGQYRSDLRRGIGNDEIAMVYNPIYRLADRSVVALEARIRWDHPRYGRLIPGHFLRRADATGLLDLLGEHVFGLIARDLTGWFTGGFDVPQIRFTLSGRQALDADLLRQLTGARERFGFPGSLFGIELSDGTSSPERAAIEQLLEQLQANGIDVGLDNYTGSNQSVAAIVRLPFNFMNIEVDQILAAGMNERTAAVMRSFVAMSQDIGVPLVAKLADEPGCIPWLQELGVQFAQGTELGRELTPAEVAALLKTTGLDR